MLKKAFGRFAAVALALLTPGLVVAQESANSGIDLTVATSFMNDAKEKIGTWVTTNSSVIVYILGAIMGLVFIFIGWKWVTRGSKKA